MSEARLAESALGAYLGLAVGDALGATVEFMSPEQISEVHGIHRRMIGGGWLNLPAGAVTDDTQMSLALGDALIAAGGFDMQRVAESFARWLRNRPVDCGATCRRGIRRFMRDGSLASPPDPNGAGNGALMRNLPLVLACLGDDAAFERCTLAQCHFTHNHPESDAAALSLGHITASLVRGEALHTALRWADRLVETYPVFAHVDYRGRASAYVVDTVRTVLWNFRSGHDFADTLIATVNRGDDADTTGALVGMLAGARFGWRAIPPVWLKRLDRRVRSAIETQVTALLALAHGEAVQEAAAELEGRRA